MPTEDGMDPAFRARVDQLIAASGGRLFLKSGYRSDAEQAQLYAAAVQRYGAANAGNWVAPPGHSNHNRGLAADIGGDLGLLAQLAPQFGLELPMSWEPWHVEPVGLREKSKPTAYTNGPPGTINPVHDPTINGQPQTIFARLSAALAGDTFHQTAEGVLPGAQPGGQPQGAVSTGAKADQGMGTGAQRGGTSKGSVDPHNLYKMLRAQGLDPAHAAALVAIAGRESNYNPAAFNGNAATGDRSFGLFQINKLGGMHAQYSDQSLLTPEGSVVAAADLVKNGGLQPWGGYKGMPWSYNTNLQAAVDASGGEVTLAQLEGLQ